LFYKGVDDLQGAKSMSWSNSFKTISGTQNAAMAKRWNEYPTAVYAVYSLIGE
jgi:hypothetical protein